MKNVAAIREFLMELGIDSKEVVVDYADTSANYLTLNLTQVEEIGKDAVLEAILVTFGKGFFWADKYDNRLPLKSIY